MNLIMNKDILNLVITYWLTSEYIDFVVDKDLNKFLNAIKYRINILQEYQLKELKMNQEIQRLIT